MLRRAKSKYATIFFKLIKKFYYLPTNCQTFFIDIYLHLFSSVFTFKERNDNSLNSRQVNRFLKRNETFGYSPANSVLY